MYSLIHGWMNKQRQGYMDGFIERWMKGKIMEEWIDRFTYGWINLFRSVLVKKTLLMKNYGEEVGGRNERWIDGFKIKIGSNYLKVGSSYINC